MQVVLDIQDDVYRVLKEDIYPIPDAERLAILFKVLVKKGTPLLKGNWIDDADKIDAQFGKHTYKCSECGKYAEYFVSGTEVWWDRIKPNFCPNCGARMVSE